MNFIERVTLRAKKNKKTLVLAEGLEPRTVLASREIMDRQIAAKVILVGAEAEVRAKADKLGVSLDGIDISDPFKSPLKSKFAKELYELRKNKGMSLEEAEKRVSDILVWGALLVRLDYADAMIAGAESATADVLRATFQIIKPAEGVKNVTSCFVMVTGKKEFGENGAFIFADCSTIPTPTSDQLVDIAHHSVESCRKFLLAEPRISFMSYSTYGSASGENVDRVRTAAEKFKALYPEIESDGELQADASIVGSVASLKAKDSKIAGRANVLIFPDLQSGNIGYKLVQRLAGAEAYGPILQGVAKPVSDLSRGCSVEDIITTASITLS